MYAFEQVIPYIDLVLAYGIKIPTERIAYFCFQVETRAIKAVFGDNTRVPVSSVKSMLGHLIAAAGATELITCILAIRDQILPPTTNQSTPDPDCDLDYIPNVPRPAKVEVCMSNSMGFGGQNNTVIIRRGC